jgi:uncharacterized protein (TIGR00255 family)
MTTSQPGASQAYPVRSMTGFARVRKPAGDTEIVVSVKSVNHRALDLHFHCPSELDPLENDMRALVRRKLTRGHVEVRIGLGRTESALLFRLNRDMLEGYLSAFRAAAAEHQIDCAPDLNSALRVPGMFTDTVESELSGEQRGAVLSTLEEALDELNRAREREASEMLSAMLRHNESIRRSAQEMAGIRQRAVPLFEARLAERLRDLLRGQAVDPQRLAQEVALLVDRSDISEEISRLEIHASQLETLLTGGGEVGKKLDFLLQEMNRETNTILSKTSGIGEIGLRITELALATKADIEKIREQSLNLE